MKTYKYKARDQSSNLVEGVMAAESENAVADKLKASGNIPVDIREEKPGKQLSKIQIGFRGVKFAELNIFTRQLFTLQKAGLPLLSGLDAIREQTPNETLKEIVECIRRDVEGGLSLSAALEKHPKVFNALYVNMVKAGEISGRLPEILERLANLGEHEEKIKMRIKTAVRYPMIVIGGIVLAFFVLISLVVPRYKELYSRFGSDLPLPTKMLIGIHGAVTEFWWLTIIVVGVLAFVFVRAINTKAGRLAWDSLKLKLPVFGPLLQKIILSRFCRLTGVLIRSGVPILQIIDLGVESAQNMVVAKTLGDIKQSVNEGNGMLEPMKASGLFPPVVTQMVSVGEETGKLDDLLLHVSDYYDSNIDYTIENLVALIEPILILILGVFVTFMALGVFLPMWNLMNLFKR